VRPGIFSMPAEKLLPARVTLAPTPAQSVTGSATSSTNTTATQSAKPGVIVLPAAGARTPARGNLRVADGTPPPPDASHPRVTSTNAPGRAARIAAASEVTISPFDLELVKFLQDVFRWTYLLLLLLLLLYLAYRTWRWLNQRNAQPKGKKNFSTRTAN